MGELSTIGDQMAYGYPPQMAPATNRIIKRPLTDVERGFVVNSFRGMQKILRSLAPVPLLLFVVSFLLLSISSGDFVLTVIYYLIVIVMVVLCVVIIGMSGQMFQLRKKTSDVLMDGTAIEVQGLAIRKPASRNIQSFNVGPISLSVQQEDSRLIQEGARVSILCVPKLNIALSVNNIALTHGASITCPPNLEAMAEPVYPVSQQPIYQQQYQPPAPQSQPPPNQPSDYPPPPGT